MAVAVTYAGTSRGLSNPLCEHHVNVSVSRTCVTFMKSYPFRLLLQGALQALAGVCQAQQCCVAVMCAGTSLASSNSPCKQRSGISLPHFCEGLGSFDMTASGGMHCGWNVRSGRSQTCGDMKMLVSWLGHANERLMPVGWHQLVLLAS